MLTAEPPIQSELENDFKAFIADSAFPCVGAKSAVAKGTMDILIAQDIRSNWNDRLIYNALTKVAATYREDRALFRSFAVIFNGPCGLTEQEFEHFLWARAESLTNKDTWLGRPHDNRVSDDPQDPHFSLSFNGEAFFIVGLHPAASRPGFVPALLHARPSARGPQ